MASRLLFSLIALSLIPILFAAEEPQFQIHGSVYCDTCRCGFETIKSYYIHGATVRIQCADRKTLAVKFAQNATTDSTGRYKVTVQGDHQDDMCYAVLVDSPVRSCAVKDNGRSRASLILTRGNGAVSSLHYANAMGFFQDHALPGCDEMLKRKYLMYEDE